MRSGTKKSLEMLESLTTSILYLASDWIFQEFSDFLTAPEPSDKK